MATRDIICCGGVVYDITTFAPRFPMPGESLVATKFIKGFGGKAANQCYMAKQLGAQTALIGKLGNDSFGADFKAYLTDNNINHDHVTMTDEAQTSVGNVIVSASGQNCIAHVLGALDYLTADDTTAAADDLFRQDSGQILLCSYECPRKALLPLLVKAKEKNLTTLVNAGPWCGEPYEETYPYVDIMCLNEVEAELATSIKVSSASEAESAARVLISKGCKTVIITMGSNGAILFHPSEDKAVHIPAPKVKAVDTTAAGDAFLGSLAFFLHDYPELSMNEKIFRACAIAAITVQFEGTQASFPKREGVPEHLLRHV